MNRVPAIVFGLIFVFLVLGTLYVAIRSVMREQEQRRQNPHMMRRGMRGIAGTALGTSSLFLMIVAVMLNSPALFYMSTAVIATLIASRVQAVLSVRGLRFERFAPEEASIGELVTVELVVWSERKIRRPLVTLVDKLPSKMAARDRTASLPIAPAFDVPVRTQYRFRPMRRGRFRWSNVEVFGTDALGLVTMSRQYEADSSEMLVVPMPIPLDMDLPAAAGFGIAETEFGQGRGSGIEPRGVREYFHGDSIRYIHWPSTMRAGRVMVKEFETGHHAAVAFLLQQRVGTDIGENEHSSLERMCGHVAYVSDRMLRQGAQVLMPTLEHNAKPSASPHERAQEVLIALAGADASRSTTLAEDMMTALPELPTGTTVYVTVAMGEEDLPAAIRSYLGKRMAVNVLLYDAREFETRRTKASGHLAIDPGYQDALIAAGATVIPVPTGVSA
jgi:uncharacterized protein (DUF58 family)